MRTLSDDQADHRHGSADRPVLVVVPHLKENGGLRVSHEAARRLPSLGVPARLFVLRRIREGVELAPDPAVPVVLGADGDVRMRQALPRVLVRLVREARRCSVVLSGTEGGPAFLLGWMAARLARRPFAVLVQASLAGSLAEWVPARLHRLTRWVHRHADLAICVSTGLVADLREAGVPEERIAVVAVGIDVDASRAAAAAPVPSVTARPYFLAVGRLVPQKGFDVLVEAYARAVDRIADHDLVVLGEGPERSTLEALRDERGLAGRVHLPGFVGNPHPLIAAADLFVLPSRYEGMGGLVLLEAMAHGVPVVAADCVSGPRDLLEDGRIGRLVPVEDPAALADALADYVAAPGPLRARAAGGPQRAREFAPERWVAALRDALSPLRTRRG